MDLRHSSLKPWMMEALICMQDWLKRIFNIVFKWKWVFEILEQFGQGNKIIFKYILVLCTFCKLMLFSSLCRNCTFTGHNLFSLLYCTWWSMKNRGFFILVLGLLYIYLQLKSRDSIMVHAYFEYFVIKLKLVVLIGLFLVS